MLGAWTAPERLPLEVTFVMSNKLSTHHTDAIHAVGVILVSFQGQQRFYLSFSIHRPGAGSRAEITCEVRRSPPCGLLSAVRIDFGTVCGGG